MSIVPKETIEVIAQSIGINNLSPDVALALAPDVEYRVREIMQEAIKCMRHSKRTILTADDVDSALSLRNVEPIYGFASGDPLRFKRAVGHKGLFYIDDKDVEFKDVIEAPLPKAPLDTAVLTHWLAIEGVQPAIPENAPVEALVAPSENKKSDHSKEDGLPVDIKLPVKHVLSRELQLYFDKITELTVSKSDSVLFKEALVSLATDSGLHPLVPYFTYFIADEVTRSLNDYPLLFALMRVVRSLLQNQHIHIEPYLHQLMPSVITCLVAKRLGNRFVDNHWELRDFTATLVASICRRFGHVYHNLQPRVTRTLLHAFLDPTKAMTQHYGAIQGLAALGPSVVRLLILPNLEPYLQLLEPEMLLEKQKNEVKRHEAWRVYGALLRAAGQCLYDRLKLFPGLLSAPTRVVWRTNGRIATMPNNKRKASNDQLSQQPPLKKVAADGPLGSISLPAGMQGTTNSFPAVSGDSDMGPSSSSRQVPNDIALGGGNRREKGGGGQAPKTMSAALTQAWKEDLDAGHLLASLFELFGEGIFSFKQSPEMSFFL
ncbi:transcription initiation factor TFIID subunit 6 [Magnolia sinica]|uniref:transcription initiation factor TFIID subunit 6 n=1 Tax=Magnolia sinica TaxID=86752 RepID=UPI00265AF03B|nr:transcription initiation factor TFIID subunit 6 [Magnolia sinica]XP_058070770.1 transcription initiation factor TFIID subunit 6 [Magnolia sinica]XP_058070771.1 transcription initiation factor TFIID subunit 6 [Magnolia sinica]